MTLVQPVAQAPMDLVVVAAVQGKLHQSEVRVEMEVLEMIGTHLTAPAAEAEAAEVAATKEPVGMGEMGGCMELEEREQGAMSALLLVATVLRE